MKVHQTHTIEPISTTLKTQDSRSILSKVVLTDVMLTQNVIHSNGTNLTQVLMTIAISRLLQATLVMVTEALIAL